MEEIIAGEEHAVFLQWHSGVHWKRRSSWKALEEYTMTKLNKFIKIKNKLKNVQFHQQEIDFFGHESRPKENWGNPRNAWSDRRCQVAPFSWYGQLPRSLLSESVFSSSASHRTHREGQSMDVGATSDQCCRQNQRDVDFCSNTHLLRSRKSCNSECRCKQLWAWCSSFASAPRWTVLLPLLLELSQRAKESTPKWKTNAEPPLGHVRNLIATSLDSTCFLLRQTTSHLFLW